MATSSNNLNITSLTTMESAYATALLRSLQYAGVKFLRYCSVDVCNNIRCKAVPIDHLLRNSYDTTTTTTNNDGGTSSMLTLDCQVSIAQICFAGLPTYADTMIAGTGMDARNVLVVKPDLFSLRVLPYAPKTALVLGTVHDQYSGDLSPLCTRGLLANVVRRAGEDHNLAFSVGAEIEFCLVDPKTWKAVDNSVFANSTTLNHQEEFISNLHDQLKQQLIDIELVHSESGPGQLEVVLRYQKDPIKLADHIVLTKETICAVARAHSLRAHFLPKYDMEKAGNGLHVHISIRDKTTGQPIFCNGASGMSEKGSAFVEGILEHVPALMGLTLPTANSFKRIGVGCWTGSRVGWAVEDKESGVRVCSNLSTQEWDHVEYKLCDGTCNLYMGLAALLSCGVDGISRNLLLRPPLQAGSSSELSESLPSSVDAALLFLEQDTVLHQMMGHALLKGFLALRRNESVRASKMTLEEEIQEALDRS